jgi:hypothetical protein
VALHATTIRFGDRGYTTIAAAADAQGISVSQYVREAALIRAVLDELDTVHPPTTCWVSPAKSVASPRLTPRVRLERTQSTAAPQLDAPPALIAR